MSKCMYQECNCEATMIIPRIIAPKNIKEDIHVCDFHFNELRKQEPVVSYSMEITGGKE